MSKIKSPYILPPQNTKLFIRSQSHSKQGKEEKEKEEEEEEDTYIPEAFGRPQSSNMTHSVLVLVQPVTLQHSREPGLSLYARITATYLTCTASTSRISHSKHQVGSPHSSS